MNTRLHFQTTVMLACALAAAGCASAVQRPSHITQPASAGAIRSDIMALADDSMMGRETPGPGIEMAAHFIEARFTRLGLRALDGQDSREIRYPWLRAYSPDVRSSRLTCSGATISATRVAYLPGTNASALETPVRIVRWSNMSLQGWPSSARGSFLLLEGMPSDIGERLPWLRHLVKQAQTAGASGILFAMDKTAGRDNIEAARQRLSSELQLRANEAPPSIPAAILLHEDVAACRHTAGLSSTVSLRVLQDAPNVVAELPGTDAVRKDSMIVFVAHFDHIGIRSQPFRGDSIYNGADDNASGTAALLSIAEAYATSGPTRYTVVFAAVSGEEEGLLGSEALLASGALDPKRVVAAINMDMVGRGAAHELTLITPRRGWLGQMVLRVTRNNPALGLSALIDQPGSGLGTRTDHASFAKRRIPSVALFAGFHMDYHQVSDEAGRIDFDKAARIAELAYRVGRQIDAR